MVLLLHESKALQNLHDAIFAEPIRRNIAWTDVVALVKALGGRLFKAMALESALISMVSHSIFTLHIPRKN